MLDIIDMSNELLSKVTTVLDALRLQQAQLDRIEVRLRAIQVYVGETNRKVNTKED